MMKKSVVLLVVLMLGLLCGCGGPKVAKPAEEVSAILKEAGYTLRDATADAEPQGLASAILLAQKGTSRVEFYVLKDQETAVDFFNNIKSSLNYNIGTKAEPEEKTGENYQSFSFGLMQQYEQLTRVDNTVLFCMSEAANKDEILDLIKKVGH